MTPNLEVPDQVRRWHALYKREQELDRHRAYTDEVLNALDDVFYVLDASCDIQRWNQRLVEATGYSDHEIASMNAFDFFDEREREQVTDALDTVFEVGNVRLATDFLRKDGTSVPFEFIGVALEDPDGSPVIAGIGRDISEQTESEREIERTRDLLQHTQSLAGVGGWELDLRHGPPYSGMWTDELYRIHELPLGSEVDMEDGIEFYHPDDRDRIRTAVTRAIETGERYDLEARLITAKGNVRWVRTIGVPVVDDGEGRSPLSSRTQSGDGEIVALRGSLQDITAQKHHELTLESLHEATRGLLRIDTERDVAALVVDVAADVLDIPSVAIYQLDTVANEFEPIALTPGFADRCLDPEPIAIGDTSSPIWNAFRTGTQTVTVLDHHARSDMPNLFDDEVRSALLAPIGDHGVFVAGSDTPVVDDSTRQVVETLVATTEAAFDRLQSEAALAERDAELATQNERLRQQIGITELIRTVDRSLVRATTREEIETAVCERLVEGRGIEFAWIGDVDPDGCEFTPRTWHGTAPNYLDAVSDDDGVLIDEPAWTTATTDEATVVPNVVDGMRDEPWRRTALSFGFQSVVCVPLVYDEFSYGVLAVYAGNRTSLGELERTVFEELGETIASSINAIETRRALHAGAVLQLKLRITGSDGFLLRLARETNSTVSYERLVTESDDETQLFVSVEGATTETVEAALDDLVSVTAWTRMSESDTGDLFEVRMTGPVVAAKLVRHGGSPQSIVAGPDGMEVLVDVPIELDVRELLEMLGEQFPSVELVSRHDVERSMHTEQELVDSILSSLSDRQREVLDAAYFGGFFEWPREKTGEEIAELLDVSQPTVNRHLRCGQKQLLCDLFGER